MKTNLVTALACLFVVIVAAVPIAGKDPPRGAPKSPAPTDKKDKPRPDGRLEIEQTADVFREAFNRADAKALSALWTKDGEFVDETGQRFAGREAIERAYAEFFAERPGAKIQIAIDSIRMLSGDTAIEDGRATLTPTPPGGAGTGGYTAVHVKFDGKWLIASSRDTRVEPLSASSQLHVLDWMIGSWTAEEDDAKMESTCRWVANKSFIERTYSMSRSGEVTASGMQIIGWDPLGQRINSWTFTSDGGHAVGVWTPADKGWSVYSLGVLADGTRTSAVNAFKQLDENAFAWQSTERVAGGTPLPDLDEVVLKRIPNKR